MTKKIKIYDCFTFFNEVELLELRLRILYPHVDYFVIVEGNKTHSGIQKKSNFKGNFDRFKEFKDKIIYLYVDLPNPSKFTLRHWRWDSLLSLKNWKPEKFQRNKIKTGLKNCRDEDIILISDLDEIPDPKKFHEMKEALKQESMVSFSQRLFYYFLNGFKQEDWVGTRACTYRSFRKIFGCRADNVRRFRDLKLRVLMLLGKKKPYIIRKGGWHFSYLGGLEKVNEKLRSFAHKEYNQSKIKNEEIEEGISPSGERIKYIEIDESFPEEIVNHPGRYKKLIKKIK